MEDTLSDAARVAGLELLKEAKLGMTGQNLVWVADINIVRGCLEGDSNLVARAFEAVARTITTELPEGIQADYSFYQHGKCLYSGGYGLGFSMDCARLAVLARGTRFAFSRKKIDLLSRYILDGQQWMMRGDVFDYGAVGREITRKGKTGRSLAGACSSMAQLDTGRRAEFEAFARRIQGHPAPEDAPLLGNRHFYRSDIMTHHRPACYTSVRMCSNRIDNTDDPCNEEGLLSHHIADGANFIFRTGNEYRDIFGVWDWQRIPGATIEQKPLSGTPRHRGAKAFAGGVSDGVFGLAAADIAQDGLVARKAWFFFEREFACLGAGIGCPSEHAVYTSINQCHLEGGVTACAGGRIDACEKGRRILEDAGWVLHDGIGYLFIEPREVTLANEAQRGSWWRINRRYPKEEISMEVFSLWIDHGIKPSNAAYAYIVWPGAEPAGLAEYAASPPVSVLSNAPGLQAVHHRETGVLGAAFFEAGSLETDAGFRLEVDRPCLVLVREMKPALQVALSNPRNEALTVQVRINRRLEGEGVLPSEDPGESRIVFELPGGVRAGRSVVRTFRSSGRDGR
jgi:chondroitin AC lyase